MERDYAERRIMFTVPVSPEQREEIRAAAKALGFLSDAEWARTTLLAAARAALAEAAS